MAAPLPTNEDARKAELDEMQILDTPAEPMWDRLAQVAALICETPIALVSLVDTERQWFKARVGLDASETSRDDAFCAHAILQHETMMVRDARRDARFRDNPLVKGSPNIRMYAGAPVHGPRGNALGTLCVIDRKPRKLTPKQMDALALLAAQADDLFRLQATGRDLRAAVANHELQPIDEMARKRLTRLMSQLGGRAIVPVIRR